MEYSTNQSVFQTSSFVNVSRNAPQSENVLHSDGKVSLRSIAAALNSHAPTPLHDQIFFHIKKALDDGQFEDVREGRLPSLRQMSSILGVSRETLSKAISKLTGYGYLAAEERKHIYVLPRNDASTLKNLDALQHAEFVCGKPRPDAESDRGEKGQLDFRPPSDDSAPPGIYSKNYLTHKYLKTLRKQSAKRARLDPDPCGLLSFREVLCEQLRRDSGIECSAENLVIFSDFKAGIDFIVRLTAKGRSAGVLENPGPQELTSILELNSLAIVEIPVDEQGMRTDILSNYGVTDTVCFVSPSLQDPLGVRLSSERAECLMGWASASNSTIVECSSSQGFLRVGSTPSLWRKSAAYQSVFVWTVASALKPWTQICCVAFSDSLVQEARRLKLIVGGDVPINEQMALQDFILDGDLLRAQRQRELVNLEKRRRLGLAFSRIFKGEVKIWRGNCGPKLVLELEKQVNADLISEALKHCGMPAKLLDETRLSDHLMCERRIAVDLDLVNLECMSNKLEQLEVALEAG